MLLAINISNTLTTLGLYEGEQLAQHWQISTSPRRTPDELALTLSGLLRMADVQPQRVRGAIVASVVPPLTEDYVAMVRRAFKARCKVVGPGLKTGMAIHYEDPREVGADRIVNAVAARHRYGEAEPGHGVLLVDFGTATLFDVVSPDGAYLGGAICPGLGISSEALFQHGARLPRVELARPPQVVGRSTVASLQSGLIYGYVSMVDGLGHRMIEEAGFPCTVVATGPLAPHIAEASELIAHVDEHLTLHGLMLLYTLNRRSRGS